jgi:hypothetical protein
MVVGAKRATVRFADPASYFFACCCLNGQAVGGARLQLSLVLLKPEKTLHKFTCKYFIGIDPSDNFNVVRRLFGAKGANMKAIVTQAPLVKLRLRGRGSGYK